MRLFRLNDGKELTYRSAKRSSSRSSGSVMLLIVEEDARGLVSFVYLRSSGSGFTALTASKSEVEASMSEDNEVTTVVIAKSS